MDILNNNTAEFNRSFGFLVNPFFQYQVSAVTDVPLSQLGIYGGEGSYTVQYFNDVIVLVPNSFQPHPASLPIGGVNVTPVAPAFNDGPLILVKNQEDPLQNGLYAVTLIYTILDGKSIVLYQLVRVNPWLFGETVPQCTRVLYRNDSVPVKEQFILQNTTLIGFQAPIFTETDVIKADPSCVVIKNPTSLMNGCKNIKVDHLARQVKICNDDSKCKRAGKR